MHPSNYAQGLDQKAWTRFLSHWIVGQARFPYLFNSEEGLGSQGLSKIEMLGIAMKT
jgi:hypothetical protein